MAVLTTEQRDDCARKLIQEAFVRQNQTAQLTTAELRLLVDNVDDYVDTNAAAINTAIDVSIRSKATASQKALALAWVALKRAGVI